MKKQRDPSSSEVFDGDSEIGEDADLYEEDEKQTSIEDESTPALYGNTEFNLALWNPQPIRRPDVDLNFLRLPWHQRAVEVIVYTVAQTEYWLSPNRWLRAWLRLNLWIAVFLGISAATVVPAVRSIMSGLTGWTGEVSLISDDIARIVHRLPPIVVTIGATFVTVYLIRRFRHRSKLLRNGSRRHSQGHYDAYDEYQ